MDGKLTRAEKHAAVVKWLGRQLKEAKWDVSASRRLRYKSIPYRNDLTCVGIDLETLMLPVMPHTALECATAFDCFAYSVKRPDVVEFPKVVALTQGLGKDRAAEVLHWLSQWEKDEDQVVMLAWALGHRDGAELQVTDNAILVTIEDVTFGVEADGKILGTFCEKDELTMPLSGIDELLTRTWTKKTSSSKFATLYREAYRKGDEVITALVAFASGCSVADIWNLVQKTKPPERVPSYRDMKKMEHILMKEKDDPFAKFYTYLVPVWLSRAQYSRVFGTPSRRDIQPSERVRQTAVEKLHKFFDKKKENKK